jgi:tubulin polyglutamylase TTLL6/13
MYCEGLGRFATKKYAKPSKKNMTNMCMHLTNYAINKRSKDFVFNKGDDTVGHKRSFSAVLM